MEERGRTKRDDTPSKSISQTKDEKMTQEREERKNKKYGPKGKMHEGKVRKEGRN